MVLATSDRTLSMIPPGGQRPIQELMALDRRADYPQVARRVQAIVDHPEYVKDARFLRPKAAEHLMEHLQRVHSVTRTLIWVPSI